jgi:signal transduction histidine kinase/ligand-binding sensor domain-containing protein
MQACPLCIKKGLPESPALKHFLSFLLLWAQCAFASAFAQGMDLRVPLNHRAFTPMAGAPATVSALAQTSDGTLWIGGSAGLSRFDGVRFVVYSAPEEESMRSSGVSSLAATPDGGLWIGYLLGRATFLKNGRAVSYGPREGFPRGTVLRFALDSQGAVWAASSTALVRLNGERWETDADSARFQGSVRGFLIDRQGTQWVASSESLFARARGEAKFREVVRSSFAFSTAAALAEAPNGEIWAVGTPELIRIKGVQGNFSHDVVSLRSSGGRRLMPIAFDRQGNLWAASESGLLRVPSQALDRLGDLDTETFSPSEGLSHVEITSILQDREGNVWIGTLNGLDRFSPSNVLRYPVNCSPTVLAAGDAGSLWITCRRAHETTESRDGTILSRHDTPTFTASYRDTGGTTWFGGPKVLAHVENGRFVMQPLPAGAGDLPVQALIRDAGGAVWIAVTRGVFRLQDGAWTEYGNLDALPRGVVRTMTLTSDAAVWFGYPDGRVARVKDRTVQIFDARDGLAVGGVMTIAAQGNEVWIGGNRGLARFDGTRFLSIGNSAGSGIRGVSGIVRARNGDLWVHGIAGISRILRLGVEEAIRDPQRPLRMETFDYLDGVPGSAPQLRPIPSVIEGTDGRIWFATSSGIVSIDAGSPLVRNALPPPVTVWALTSGERRYRNIGENIALPVHTDRLRIEYSAGSLTVPERVRFRVRLDGLDREWQDAGDRREAVYVNLGPGDYRFHVTASNNDGVWNETGSSLAFSIAPAYYQTRWFDALCVLAALLVLFVLYRLRLRQVSAQIRGRLEARLAERERIARDLHDTLLQGVQGLILRFQAATDRIPAGEPARELMEKSLDRADHLLAESRDKVRDLRPSASDATTLEQALAIEGAHFAEFRPAELRISVQGALQNISALVREEIFLIGREALGNAFRHSGAANIEIEVTYGEKSLQIRIRDDGEGVAADVLAAGGKPGHFGLAGMRERAGKLGAHLKVWSKPGAGTEVELRVPASMAYTRAVRPAGLRGWEIFSGHKGEP